MLWVAILREYILALGLRRFSKKNATSTWIAKEKLKGSPKVDHNMNNELMSNKLNTKFGTELNYPMQLYWERKKGKTFASSLTKLVI